MPKTVTTTNSTLSPNRGYGGKDICENSRVVPLARRLRKRPTAAQQKLWQIVRGQRLGAKFRRQAPVHGSVTEFYVPALMLVIELVALLPTPWGTARRRYFRRLGYELIQIPENTILSAPDVVERQLRDVLIRRSLVTNTPARRCNVALEGRSAVKRALSPAAAQPKSRTPAMCSEDGITSRRQDPF